MMKIRGYSSVCIFKCLFIRLANDGSVRCFLNYYFNGNACVGMRLISRIIVMNDISYHMISKKKCFTECPAGLFGNNCSALCPYPFYGTRCNETCTCSNSSCHHAYGCKTTTLSSGRYNHAALVGFFSDPQSYVALKFQSMLPSTKYDICRQQ